VPFVDWPYLQSSDTAHVSGITVKCGTYIDSIQVSLTNSSFLVTGRELNTIIFAQATYKTKYNRRNTSSKGLCYGGAGGQAQSFLLNPGEYIVAVLGRHDDWIVQLRFVTNRGNTSAAYGGSSGQPFECKAPSGSNGQPMRLCFIMGKR
jgi:hypothetical protein